MKSIFKISGLALIAVMLIFANVKLIINTIFAYPSNAPSNIKSIIIPSNGRIKMYADSLLGLNGSTVEYDSIESNKRIIKDSNKIVAYAYIIAEEIACPTCSNVNYLVFIDSNYTIKQLVFLGEIIEGYRNFPLKEFEKYSSLFVNENLLNEDFSTIKIPQYIKKHSIYFKESILKLQKQIRLFYEG